MSSPGTPNVVAAAARAGLGIALASNPASNNTTTVQAPRLLFISSMSANPATFCHAPASSSTMRSPDCASSNRRPSNSSTNSVNLGVIRRLSRSWIRLCPSSE